MADEAKTHKPSAAGTDRTAGADGADGVADGAELARAYRPGDVEHAVFQRWLDADVFNPTAQARGPTGPSSPSSSSSAAQRDGSLHLGHAQRSTVEDLMTRHARMQGRPALFLPGLDHASIAAQYVLDKILAKKGETRQTLGRDKYLEAMWEFVRETRETILGSSAASEPHWT